MLHELAYLRVFNAWEVFLEDCFLRYMCGYRFHGRAETPLAAHSPDLASARTALFGARTYLLWHGASEVVRRANTYFVAGNRIATVIGSAVADLDNFACVRHRIAHDHADARQKFDNVAMALTARRFPKSRAGSFLQFPTTHSGLPMTWLERIIAELESIAVQLAP